MEMSKTRAGLDAMDRVLASAEFSRSGRLSSFLRYVCTATLADNSIRLTEQHIGVEVFGRPPHYLPADDTIVRTTAGLLRKRLAKYYETEGSADPVRIAIPRGSYVPVFAPACAAPAPAATADDPDPAAIDQPTAAPEPKPDAIPAPALAGADKPAPRTATARPRPTLPAWLRARGRLRNLVCALAAGIGVLAFTVSGAFSPGARSASTTTSPNASPPPAKAARRSSGAATPPPRRSRWRPNWEKCRPPPRSSSACATRATCNWPISSTPA